MELRQYLDQRGAVARLAREIGITHAAVRQWRENGIPAERVLAVERATGISRHALRPDVFGPAPEQEAA